MEDVVITAAALLCSIGIGSLVVSAAWYMRADFSLKRAQIERRSAQRMRKSAREYEEFAKKQIDFALNAAKQADAHHLEVRNMIGSLYGLPAEKPLPKSEN